jgi:alkylation response protein AidB-like acyl-CoA dehydrogenase
MSVADVEAAAARLQASAGPTTTPAQAAELTEEWAQAVVPESWRAAANDGGPVAVRAIRTRDEYRAWYPAFGACGLVAATWPVEYGGLDWPREAAQAAETVLSRLHLPRLNPLGLNRPGR